MNKMAEVEKVAKRFSHRPGCRFVGAQEVGIAVYVMDLRVIVLEPREIPPIDEFLLRGLRLAVERESELSSFLGLDRRTVRNRLTELYRAELIAPIPESEKDDPCCRLTLKGTSVTDSLQRSELTEITVPDVVFHGFLRRPILVDKNQLLRPRDLVDGIGAIPPMPSRYPAPDEIKLNELTEVVKRQWSQKRKGKAPELVNVRSILKNVRTMYLPAVMLQYELLGKARRQQVAFAVDGLLQEDYEKAFAKDGPQRVPDLLVQKCKTTAELAADVLPPHVVRSLGSLKEADELVEQLDRASAEVERKESILDAEDRADTRLLLREELEKEKVRRKELEERVAQIKVISLKTHDCRHVLTTTLRDVKQRLVILSAFLSSDVVDRQFVETLEAALKREVQVWIGYGMGNQGGRDQERTQRGDWKDAERALRTLSNKYPTLMQVRDFGNTHEKILIRDSDFIVTGSFNWLSFRPKGKKVRFEDAAQIKIPDYVEQKFQEIVARFGKP